MDRTGSVLDVLIPNLQQTPRTVVPYRYLMRKRGGEREQFWPQKLVLAMVVEMLVIIVVVVAVVVLVVLAAAI